MTSHLEDRLEKNITKIREKVITMGSAVHLAITGSHKAYHNLDPQLAYFIILRDRYIDEMETELDRLCQEFLVREQPVAGHLRFVYAVIKINNELERIGDYAESIATQLLNLTDLDKKIDFPDINQIAELALSMLKNALHAFSEQDPELANDTIETEEQVNEIRKALHQELLNRHHHGKIPSEALSPLMIIINRFERVADQACNICEEVLYMCTGQMIKHSGEDIIRVLFVDEIDNSRGPMARGIAKSLELQNFQFSSAGFSTTTEIPPQITAFMDGKGIDISDHKPKTINQLLNLDSYSVIITLSKEADNAFPPSPTKIARIRWKVKNPLKVKTGDKSAQETYEKIYRFFDSHIRDLVKAIRINPLKEEEST